MYAVDQQLEAVEAWGGQRDSSWQSNRQRQRDVLLRFKLTRISDSEFNAELRKRLTVGPLQPNFQLVASLSLCRVNQNSQSEGQPQRRRKGTAASTRHTAAEDV